SNPAAVSAPLSRRVRQTVHRPVPEPLDGEQLTAVVAGMRAGDRADDSTGSGTVRADGSRASGAATVSLLQTATQVGRAIAIGYVDAQGTAIRRVVEPVGFSGGMLEAVDPVTGVRHTFSLHRITSVSLVD
ncbi:MAG: WYL domain-containing protein, partial [Tomitella sp.]|nr:WYL domain-containing protein [Tomitella sp.]